MSTSLDMHCNMSVLTPDIVFFSCRLLEDRVNKFSGHLHHCQQHIQQAEASGGIHNVDYGSKELHQLFEDLHWLVLISGW